MKPFTFKHNDAPCGPNCPERSLPDCRHTCERWQIYERNRLEKAAQRHEYLPHNSITQGKSKCVTRYIKQNH